MPRNTFGCNSSDKNDKHVCIAHACVVVFVQTDIRTVGEFDTATIIFVTVN